MLATKNCLIIFAKSPQGRANKTRLRMALDENEVANLATLLLKHTVSMATSLTNVAIQLSIWGDIQHPCFQAYREHPSIFLHPQRGKDFGYRLSHAVQSAFARYQHIVVIGSDCPVMTPRYIENAFSYLHQTTDVVIGPALDGGYTLLGLNYPYLNLFKKIPWGTTSVLSITLERLKILKIKWIELAKLWDIDHPTELAKFREWYATHINEINKLSYTHSLHEIYNSIPDKTIP